MSFPHKISSGVRKFLFLPVRTRKISILVACVCASAICVMLLVPSSRGEIIVSVIVGVLLAWMLAAFRDLFLMLGEDRRKIHEDHDALQELYDESYLHTLSLYNGTELCFFYDPLFHNPSAEPLACPQSAAGENRRYAAVCTRDERLRVEIEDHPERLFRLNGMLASLFLKIFQAHKGSFLRNYPTLRLADFRVEESEADGTVLRFETMRSTYFDHLVTNRAMDYAIDELVSVRTMFEYGPMLNSLRDSQLSNHIGINAIVYLSDGTMLFKQRNNTATISKGMLTSSIAAKIDLADPTEPVTVYQLLIEPVLRGLIDRLGIYDKKHSTSREKRPLPVDRMDIYLLGVGRNIYEGGKPHLYLAVYLKNLSLGDYLREYMTEYRKLMRTYKFDGDRMLYFCTPQTQAAEGRRLRIAYHYYSTFRKRLLKRLYVRELEVEKSFLCNYWHLMKNEALRERLRRDVLAWSALHPDQKTYLPSGDAQAGGSSTGKRKTVKND